MRIEREITAALLRWKASARRKPLLLKGVRQCGKTWLLTHFGKEHFDSCAYFNFDRQQGLSSLFDGDYDPAQLLLRLSAFSGQQLVPGNTLIVFDEIQLCPRALNSLKYFCEEAPEYAIAAAGSLLGGSLARSHSGFPVGKVDTLELTPCSFREYLRAANPALVEYISTLKLAPLEDAFAAKLTAHLREYLTFGGMPAALSAFLESKDLHDADDELDAIMDAYVSDFSKHIPASDTPKLSLLWQSIPAQFARENRRFFYSEVRPGARAKDLEDALQWLLSAQMVRKVDRVETPEYPLAAVADQKIFKLYPTDVGVLRKLARIGSDVSINSPDLFADFKGRLAENFALEQLASLGYNPICYWCNAGGTAEVDFLIQNHDQIVPIEVKSGLSLNAKSLKVYRQKYQPQISVRTSLQNLRFDDGLLNIPLYLLSELPRFLKELQEGSRG